MNWNHCSFPWNVAWPNKIMACLLIPSGMSRIKMQVSKLTKVMKMVENQRWAKIDARDATIATLVLSWSNEEASISDLKSELNRLQTRVENKLSSESVASEQWKDLEASQRREVKRLRDRTHGLTLELKQTKRRLLSVMEFGVCHMRTGDIRCNARCVTSSRKASYFGTGPENSQD